MGNKHNLSAPALPGCPYFCSLQTNTGCRPPGWVTQGGHKHSSDPAREICPGCCRHWNELVPRLHPGRGDPAQHKALSTPQGTALTDPAASRDTSSPTRTSGHPRASFSQILSHLSPGPSLALLATLLTALVLLEDSDSCLNA